MMRAMFFACIALTKTRANTSEYANEGNAGNQKLSL